MARKLSLPAAACLAMLLIPESGFSGPVYVQTNLSSDLPGVAAHQDPNLVNPWGIAFSATSPFWISDNHTGLATLYTGTGLQVPLVVTIPPPLGQNGPAAPTGAVFNATPDFNGSHFIFATEDGTIAAWTSGTAAALAVDHSPSGAVYKGLAIGNNGSQNLLYAANFNSGQIDAFDATFAPFSTPGGFHDPAVPAGFAPFNIQNVGGRLLVTYAEQNAARHDDVSGPGNGYVDAFDFNGHFLQRLVSNGPLNSPWGLALAPANFGAFSNDLLIGNFGDGTINAFNPLLGTFLGTLSDSNGPIVNQGLWGLAFRTGGPSIRTDALYFTAGIPGPDAPDVLENHGLFGAIEPVPEPGTVWLVGSSVAMFFVRRRRRTD